MNQNKVLEKLKSFFRVDVTLLSITPKVYNGKLSHYELRYNREDSWCEQFATLHKNGTITLNERG